MIIKLTLHNNGQDIFININNIVHFVQYLDKHSIIKMIGKDEIIRVMESTAEIQLAIAQKL